MSALAKMVSEYNSKLVLSFTPFARVRAVHFLMQGPRKEECFWAVLVICAVK